MERIDFETKDKSSLEKKIFSQEFLIEKLGDYLKIEGSWYQKQGSVEVRKAQTGEVVETITSDGKETQNIAKEGDFVVRNPGGEEYIIEPQRLIDRYELDQESHLNEDGYRTYKSIGKRFGIVANEEVFTKLGIVGEEDEFEFVASWGEKMRCRKGDMLVTRDIDTLPSITRIAIHEFNDTYTLTT